MRTQWLTNEFPQAWRRSLLPGLVALGLCLVGPGCMAPIGADRTSPARAYRQIHANAVSQAEPSPETRAVLHRFDQTRRFATTPDLTLQWIHEKAVASGERDLLYALSELSYLTGERVRRSVKPWDPRDARDYYLAAAVYAWFYLFGEAQQPPPGAFDQRFRTACDLYNYGLSQALMQRRGTNATVVLASGLRRLPVGRLEVQLTQPGFPWPLTDFQRFEAADQFVVRGLSVRNHQAGLGAPLVAVGRPEAGGQVSRTLPATVFLRVEGQLKDLNRAGAHGSLELHSTFDDSTIQVEGRAVPLETDTTVAVAYGLNQSLVWRLGMLQFLSGEETIPTGVYLRQPWQAGRVPVVFVHGTFSSPVWWAEMANTLAADPVLRRRYQVWYFIYNSGNPTLYSANKLRESLTAKVRELDPEGKDPALRQMVVIGHSQGGLLTKLTATDTGDTLLEVLTRTNRLETLALTADQQALVRRYLCIQALPFVREVIFISTPHRGSYLATSLTRNLARKFVSLPSKLVNASAQFVGITQKLNFPAALKGTPTSLDSMSPKNPFLVALAGIPLAPGVKGHSIIPVKGEGDYHQGRDGLVTYTSAHVDYVESEFIVRGPHSCQGLPPTIEEVRRILHEHVRELPAQPGGPSGP